MTRNAREMSDSKTRTSDMYVSDWRGTKPICRSFRRATTVILANSGSNVIRQQTSRPSFDIATLKPKNVETKLLKSAYIPLWWYEDCRKDVFDRTD